MHLAEVLAATEGAADAGDVTARGTFVGMPAVPRRRRARRWPTPSCARNLAHATATIRAKRAKVVAEVDDWEELRLAGAAIKDNTLLHLDEHLRAARGVADRGAARSCTGRATPTRPARSSPTVAQAHGVDEVVKVKSMATAGDRAQRGAGGARASRPGRPTSPS